jgi:hypothetical protein
MYFPLLLQSAFAYGESRISKGKQTEPPFQKRGLATLPKQEYLRFQNANASYPQSKQKRPANANFS